MYVCKKVKFLHIHVYSQFNYYVVCLFVDMVTQLWAYRYNNGSGWRGYLFFGK